jgi:hypothetical protein
LNTPGKSNAYIHANENVISGYKKMGDKILFYIKLFFKNKNKSHKLKSSRHHKHRATLKHKRHASKSKLKSRRIKDNSNAKKENKTRKTGVFMRV